MKGTKYQLCAVYDTETCNIGEGADTRAYPILFIDNDIRDKNIYDYEVDKDDKVNFYRTEQEYVEKLREYIAYGEVTGSVPIVCAYNAMFDLQPLMQTLSQLYLIVANAQSSTNIYTLDLLDKADERPLLRFWDTFHLETGGLKAMGETCGIAKATGDWDYSLIRTPETELTDLELYYAKRDVQVIPAYLRYLLHANEWMKQSDLGSRVLTKTSIVRQMAKHNIAPIKVTKSNGKKLTLAKAFNQQCLAQLPKTFAQYALRKGCFRGGFTFTSAAFANTIQRNVASLDVTSMHHTFINGRYIPLDFQITPPSTLQAMCEEVIATTRGQVLAEYHKPFRCAFHARVRFTNVRIREGSCFDAWGIGLLSTAKFKREIATGSGIGNDPRNVEQENAVRELGYHDTYTKAIFALGKLYAAEEATVHVSELELWCMSRVYEWDSMKVIGGESTIKWKIPTDYVTLQSNILFETKNDVKFINNHYTQGTPYPYRIPSTIPEGIAEELRQGTCSEQFLEAWYVYTVKGGFNGIYGTQAQDVYKPSYTCEEGELMIDQSTVTRSDNWEEKQPKSCKVLYTYGLRIVGGSRMHLVIALELMFDALGEHVRATGGDTDSIKVSCDDCVTDQMLADSLEPIAKASKAAIDACMRRMRQQHPDMASNLTGIGSFDIETADKATKSTRYEFHMEAWNKARVSYVNGHSHITCAGLSRPEGAFTIEDFIDALIESGNPIEDVFKAVLGYNVTVSNGICHALEGHKPKAHDVFDRAVTDYEGNTAHVRCHESQSLYPASRVLGDTSKPTNALSVAYLKDKYGRNVDTRDRHLVKRGNECVVLVMGENGTETMMRGESK